MSNATRWEALRAVEPDLAEDLVRRVSSGAAFLDRLEPDWYLRIWPGSLAMETCDQCILGQLHGDFHRGFRRIVATLPSTILYSASGHGFTLHDREQRITWRTGDEGLLPVIEAEVMLRFAALADLWRAEVRTRRGEILGPFIVTRFADVRPLRVMLPGPESDVR